MILSGKVAIVTGSSRGIGKAIALRFAKEGAFVVINSRKMESAKAVAEEFKNLGYNTVPIACDVSKSEEVKAMVDETVKKFGRIDILVNNAGVVDFVSFLDLTEEQWDRLMDIDLKGVYLCSQAVAKQMVKQGTGGKIINIASIAGFICFPELVHYCAAKAGVIQLTKGMSVDLAKHKINVNCIGPGVIETDMTKDLLQTPEGREWLLTRIPWGRFGKPKDVAGAALFLASGEADYITGTTLFVDGGWLTE